MRTRGGSRALVWADPLSLGLTASQRQPNMISCHNHGFARAGSSTLPAAHPTPPHSSHERLPAALHPTSRAAPWARAPAGLTCSISRLNWAIRGLRSRRGAAPTSLRPLHLGAAADSLPLGLSFWGDDTGDPASCGEQRSGGGCQCAVPGSPPHHLPGAFQKPK